MLLIHICNCIKLEICNCNFLLAVKDYKKFSISKNVYPVNVFYFVDRVAIRAIELKNHSSLNGKVIRVMWLSRDADARKSGKGNVFVKVCYPLLHYIALM